MKYVAQHINKYILTLFVLIFSLGTLFSQQSSQANQDNSSKYLYGIASWYGDQFNGQTTASGSKYDPNGLSAGHRSLPFGTRVEIENLSNSKKVQVIINDRGPFEKNRVINLSKQAADVLGFMSEGTTFVKITVLELGTSLPSPLGTPTPPNIGQDIPQNPRALAEPTPQETSTPEPQYDDYGDDYDQDLYSDEQYALLDDQALFADLNDELDFMDDEDDIPLTNKNSQLKAQDPLSLMRSPVGFETNAQDIFINDPLSNITIGPEDEYVVSPRPPSEVRKTSSQHLSPEEQRIIQEDNFDPFSDLFNDSADPYNFQDELYPSLTAPSKPKPAANNVNGSDKVAFPTPRTNTAPKPSANTNTLDEDEELDFYPEDYPEDDLFTEPVTQSPPPVAANTPQEPQQSITNTPPSNTQEVTPQKLGTHYVIQLGAFSKQKNAMELYEKLRNARFNAYITDVKVKNKNMMRVRVGHFSTIDEAMNVSTELQKLTGFENRVIKVEIDE